MPHETDRQKKTMGLKKKKKKKKKKKMEFKSC
jgi:hypothetical protein